MQVEEDGAATRTRGPSDEVTTAIAHSGRGLRQRKFQSMNATLDGTLRGVMGSRLVRTMLDVEEGAIYFERADSRSYFMGVTLDQEQVHTARQSFNQLVLAVQATSRVTHR